MRIHTLLLGCLLTMFCSGCFPNHAVYKQSSIRLEGAPTIFGGPKYSHVQVGSLSYPYDPYIGTPEFRMRLDSGRVISSRELTPELVSSECSRVELGSRFGGPDGSRVYFSDNFSFSVVGNRVVELSAGIDKEGRRPAFGAATGGPLYELPLTAKQAAEIFGKADEEYESLVL